MNTPQHHKAGLMNSQSLILDTSDPMQLLECTNPYFTWVKGRINAHFKENKWDCMQNVAATPLYINLLLWKEERVGQAINLMGSKREKEKKDGCTEKNWLTYKQVSHQRSHLQFIYNTTIKHPSTLIPCKTNLHL